MTDRTASCSCGQLKVVCRGNPVRVSVCHCMACRRRTGSVFGAQARFPDAAATVEGESRVFMRRGDEGGEVTSHFCPDCGSTVYWRLDAISGFTSVAIGAFADPAFPPPQVSVYDEHRCHWLRFDTETRIVLE